MLKLLQADAFCSSVLVHNGHCASGHQRHELLANLHRPLVLQPSNIPPTVTEAQILRSTGAACVLM